MKRVLKSTIKTLLRELQREINPKPKPARKPGKPFAPWFYEDVKEKQKGVQASEFTRAYNSPSGMDYKFYMSDAALSSPLEVCGTLQGICWGPRMDRPSHEDGTPQWGGSLVFIMFDGEAYQELTDLLGKQVHIKLVYANEYGKVFTHYEAIVRFDDQDCFGVSVDDIVSEVTINFTLVQRIFPGQEKEEEKDDKDRSETVPAE